MRGLWAAPLILFLLVSSASVAAADYEDIAEGGSISVLVLEQFNVSSSWTGYYGDLLVSGNPVTGWLLMSNVTSPGNVTGENMSIRCTDVEGYLLISNESTVPDLEGLVPGDLSVLDAMTGSGHDSASNTFDVNTSFEIADEDIDDVPTLWPNIDSQPQSAYFREGYMTDGDALVFVAVIDQDTVGFDGRLHDFQFMLPYGPNENYYVYALFSCKWCGDGICMFGEDCLNCPDDCGECEAEKPKTRILTPGMPITLPPPKPVVNLELKLDKDVFKLGEKVSGTITAEYTGQDELQANIVLSLQGTPVWKEPVLFNPPYSRRKLRFSIDLRNSGGYNLVASVEGISYEIRGKRVDEQNFILSIPEEEKVIEKEIVVVPSGVAACQVLGIPCMAVILALLMVVISLFLLIKRPRKRKRHRQIMDWMWAIKYNIKRD